MRPRQRAKSSQRTVRLTMLRNWSRMPLAFAARHLLRFLDGVADAHIYWQLRRSRLGKARRFFRTEK